MTATPLVGSTFFGMDVSQLGQQFLSIRRRVSKRVLLLEFSLERLRLAEAVITPAGVQLNHISMIQLPADALDRGVPAEPRKMAGLIKEICVEKKIPAHRVAVVLSPELAFQRLVDLPAELSAEEARTFVLDPSNGLQIPFPLAQTDFDLSPVSISLAVERPPGMQLYMLSAIPQALVDRVIEMLQFADLELQLLEIGSLSQLRSLALDVVMLGDSQAELVLELLPEGSNLMLVNCSGLLGIERLASIRDFPSPDLDEEQAAAALSAGLSAESYAVQEEGYLPISELDLRVLISDIKDGFSRFNQAFPGSEIRSLQLTGINSAHPLLADLLQEKLGLPVLAHRPLLAPGVAGFSMDEVLVQTSLGRLVGLALGLLPKEQLVTCPIDPARGRKSSVLAGVLLDQLVVNSPTEEALATGINESQSVLIPEILDKNSAADEFNASASSVLHIEEPQVDEDDAFFSSVLDVLDESDRWPSIGGAMGELEDEVESVEDEVRKEEVEEWPSIGGAMGELEDEVESVEDEVRKEEVEEWPSIGGAMGELVDEVESVADELRKEEVEEWPSITGLDLVGTDTNEQSDQLALESPPAKLDGLEVAESGLVDESVNESLQSAPSQGQDSGDLLTAIPDWQDDTSSGAADSPTLSKQIPDSPTVDKDEIDDLGELRFASDD